MEKTAKTTTVSLQMVPMQVYGILKQRNVNLGGGSLQVEETILTMEKNMPSERHKSNS